MKDAIAQLEVQQKKSLIYVFREAPYAKAKKEIIKYLKKIKFTQKEISVFEISQKLEFPAEQVEEVLEELEKKKKVLFKHG